MLFIEPYVICNVRSKWYVEVKSIAYAESFRGGGQSLDTIL